MTWDRPTHGDRPETPDGPDTPSDDDTFDPLAEIDPPDEKPPERPDPGALLDELPEHTTGQRTEGRFVDARGDVREIRSGGPDTSPEVEATNARARELGIIPPNGHLQVATHVEMKYAAKARAEGITEGTLVINKAGGPCPGIWAATPCCP